MIQVKSRVDLITRQMESDQAWTKNRLDDMGRLQTMLNLDAAREEKEESNGLQQASSGLFLLPDDQQGDQLVQVRVTSCSPK